MKTTIASFLGLCLLLTNCGITKQKQQTETLWIAPYQAECRIDGGFESCYLVHKGAELDAPKWEEKHRETIAGLDFEAGTLYKVKAAARMGEASSETTGYEVLEVLEKRAGDWSRLYDIWAVESIAGKEIGREGPRPNMEINLTKMSVMGNTGCNQYRGKIKLVAPGSLQFGMLATTRKMCKDMEVPNRFKAAMDKVSAYRLEGLKLFLSDAEGKELMRLQKVD